MSQTRGNNATHGHAGQHVSRLTYLRAIRTALERIQDGHPELAEETLANLPTVPDDDELLVLRYKIDDLLDATGGVLFEDVAGDLNALVFKENRRHDHGR